jgi:hypothetical protein
VGARFSAPVQTGPGAHPASYRMVTKSLSWKQNVGTYVSKWFLKKILGDQTEDMEKKKYQTAEIYDP